MTTPTDAHCRNCGSPLYGEHCYACGQPTKGLVRHFSSILGDVADTIFNIDGRILRTLPALLLKPGFLTREYIDGHRVRYVSPVRLFVFLCIGTFFAAKLATPSFEIGRDDAVRVAGTDTVVIDPDANEGFEEIDTVEGVEKRLAEVRAEMAEDRAEAKDLPAVVAMLDAAEQQMADSARRRIEALRKAQNAAKDNDGADSEAPASGITLDDNDDTPDLNFNGKPWDATSNPLIVDALPDAANDWLNAQIGHIPQNWKRVREDPDLLRNAFYSALPTALFVLVPVFALLLKILFVYQRRMYMEHLVAALHGHAFVCAMLLVLMAMTSIETLLGSPAWLAAPMGWLEWLALLWIPAYLWLHLKRVSGQGWFATSVNFAILGIAEVLLLAIVAVLALLAALVWL